MFKIGDIITGKPESDKAYFITNTLGKYKIIGIDYELNKIVVLIIDHVDKHNIGNVYGVEEQYFELAKIGGASLK